MQVDNLSKLNIDIILQDVFFLKILIVFIDTKIEFRNLRNI